MNGTSRAIFPSFGTLSMPQKICRIAVGASKACHLVGSGVPGLARCFSMSDWPLAWGGDMGTASPSYTSNRPCFCDGTCTG